jgi:GNAT superfamily N-acetyltransferase
MLMTRLSVPTTIRRVRAADLDILLPDLVNVFRDTVNGGSPLGFLAPITTREAHDHWVAIVPELAAGSRILLVAHGEQGVIGSGQLVLSQRPNSPHRAEIQKLFVSRKARGQGVGKSLMHALHEVARENGRTLILLNTRHGQPPEDFYKSLGYRVVGVIPGWTIGPNGERYDHVEMYRDLEGSSELGAESY